VDESICAMSNIAVALLGPDIEHKISLEAMLAGRVSKVTWIPDSSTFAVINKTQQSRRFSKMAEAIIGTRSQNYLDHALTIVDKNAVDTVIGYWGSIPFPDLIALKKKRPHLKIVIFLLCFPLSLNSLGIRKQLFGLNNVGRYLTGVIYPSTAMAKYVARNVKLPKDIKSVIVPPAWSEEFLEQITTDDSLEHPNLVFLGRTDLSGATIHPADDIRSIMCNLMDAGIHLNHAFSPETNDNHLNRHLFEPRPVRPLIHFASRFDASLIVYNLAHCGDASRFENTVPDRLLSSVAAGLPIALPEEGYAGCKEYLRDYGATFTYRSPDHLKTLLSDAQRVSELKSFAASNRHHYTAQNIGRDLSSFLQSL
jgi:hypothetical protein